MEDVDLSIRMHELGSTAKAKMLQGHNRKPGNTHEAGLAANPEALQGHNSRNSGRTCLVMNPVNVTSGRRLSNWGAVQATWIHFYIALRWYFGASPDQMYRIYRNMYTDNHR